MVYYEADTSCLYHHGIKGQKWGVRRWQNEDGSLTPEGIRRYGTVENFNYQRARKKKIARNVGIGLGAATAVGLGTAFYLNSTKSGQKLKQDIKMASNFKKSLKEGNLNETYNKLMRLKDINEANNGKSRRFKMYERAANQVFNKQAAKATAAAKARGIKQGIYEYATSKDKDGAQSVAAEAVKQAGKTAVNTAVQTLVGKGTKMATEAAVGAVAAKGRDYVTKKFGEQAGGYMFQNPNKKQ